MDKERLAKMLNKGYLDDDSKIAKLFLIKNYPHIIRENNNFVKLIYNSDLKKEGIHITFGAVSLSKIDFPELWKKQQQ